MAVIREISSDDQIDPSLNALREFLESTTQPAAVTKASGRLVLSNGELFQLFPQLELVTAGESFLLHEVIVNSSDESRRTQIGKQLIGAVQKANSTCVPEQLRISCSSQISLHVTISPQLREGSKPYLLWSFRDVGNDNRLEERDQHSRKMQTLTRFAGGMAHEFNNLLTAILGNLELMRVQTDEPIETVMGNIESAEIAALRASSLIQELRRFGTREIPLREVRSVVRSIRRVRRILSGTVSKNIEVTQSFDSEHELHAHINSDQFEEAMLKLGVNSAEAIGKAEGQIHISACSAVDESGKPIVRIDISDTGRGMCEATREQAFEPLFTTKDEAKASGLGMSIAHGLIEEMGGYIRISDTSDKGSVVSVFLPRESSNDVAEEESSVNGSSLPALRIATLDNERSIRNVLSGMLALLGHSVEAFGDGKELVHALESGDRFDLVIIDHVMPGMTGRATYVKLRDIDSNVPVIISSGKGIDISRFCPECLTKPNAFLKKPFSMEEVASVLSSVTVGQCQK